MADTRGWEAIAFSVLANRDGGTDQRQADACEGGRQLRSTLMPLQNSCSMGEGTRRRLMNPDRPQEIADGRSCREMARAPRYAGVRFANGCLLRVMNEWYFGGSLRRNET